MTHAHEANCGVIRGLVETLKKRGLAQLQAAGRAGEWAARFGSAFCQVEILGH